MSHAQRLCKAKRLHGKLMPEQRQALKSDVLLLIDGKSHEKSEPQIKQELIQFLGWNRHVMNGPRPYVYECLDELIEEGLIEVRYEINDASFDVRSHYCKKGESSEA